MEKIKSFLKGEPLVVINAVAVVIAGIYQEVVADLEPGDTWKVVAVAVATAAARRLVTPVAES